jgi:hypothetical protein
MARIFSKTGTVEIVPHDKKTNQGMSKNTKFSRTPNSSRKKRSRGQGNK